MKPLSVKIKRKLNGEPSHVSVYDGARTVKTEASYQECARLAKEFGALAVVLKVQGK